MTEILPLEKGCFYDSFVGPYLQESDFDANPMVLLIGPYSVGKTSFIEYYLGEQYPGAKISPEPTTDRFTAVMYGNERRRIPGNAVVKLEDFPFKSLKDFNSDFLDRFEVVQMPNERLHSVTFIDTPGILSGEEKNARGYDLCLTIKEFASRCDRIFVLFDASKLDISTEMKTILQSLKGYETKMRIILNKADDVDEINLMKIYGSLMLSIGRSITSPEVPDVFCCSLKDQPYKRKTYFAKLYNQHQDILFNELSNLYKQSVISCFDRMTRRVHKAKCLTILEAHLRSKWSSYYFRDPTNEILDNLEETISEVKKGYQFADDDIPDANTFREKFTGRNMTFRKFPSSSDMYEKLEKNISREVSNKITMMTTSEKEEEKEKAVLFIEQKGLYERCEESFVQLHPRNGKVPVERTKQFLNKNNEISPNVLDEIMKRVDNDDVCHTNFGTKA